MVCVAAVKQHAGSVCPAYWTHAPPPSCFLVFALTFPACFVLHSHFVTALKRSLTSWFTFLFYSLPHPLPAFGIPRPPLVCSFFLRPAATPACCCTQSCCLVCLVFLCSPCPGSVDWHTHMTLLGSGLCRKDDVVLQVADCSFDLHLRDVYCFISFGGHVVTVPAQALSDMDLLTELFYRHQVCCPLPQSARWASLDSNPPIPATFAHERVGTAIPGTPSQSPIPQQVRPAKASPRHIQSPQLQCACPTLYIPQAMVSLGNRFRPPPPALQPVCAHR